ncbi:MAG: hypothetical protein LUM44_12995 [Pyrinomonadaceae bacterium]|nr:hypothetical protein [Pyrinomonadaceae bacterium]
MKFTVKLENRIFKSLITLFVVFLFFSLNAYSQSTDQLFPTPVTINEISGKIKARDLGDSRLTTYYYVFNGEQGDVFINVVTSNFSGDIDIFSNDGARTLTKMVIYADSSVNETGRVVYLRKPEKLLLRIEGRTQNDDDATFRIKFAGSFQAITDGKTVEQPKLPEVKTDTSSGIRVNSVGTIVEVIPKPTPQPKEIPVAVEEKPEKKEVVKEISIGTEETETVVAEASPKSEKTDEKVTEVAANADKTEENKTEEPPKVNDPTTPKKKPKTIKEKKPVKTAEIKKEEPIETAEKESEKSEEKTVEKVAKAPKPKKTKPEKAVEPDPLANIRLVVIFKDGTKLERPMNEILKFGVDKGILTVIAKDGTIGRYSILDVAKMTVE